MAYDPIVSDLLDIYSLFLTEKQRICLDLYYNQDFSLSEIASYYNITRQGVQDFILRGKNSLFSLEKKIKFSHKLNLIKNDINEIVKQTNILIDYNNKNCCSKKINEIANNVLNITNKYI